MSDTLAKTIGRGMPDGGYLEIRAESPGFSITCSGWERHGTWSGRACARNGRDSDFGGCAHEEILRVAPELAPLVTAHLADPDGTPMHAEANGWYFYSSAHLEYELRSYGQEYVDRHGSPHERAARSLAISPAELPEGLDRDGFAAFCRTLAATVWPEQAAAARAVLAAMVDGEGVEPRRY